MYTRSRKRFSTRGFRRGPEREWLAVSGTVLTTAGAGVGVTSLLALEAPTITAGTPLTSDAPADRVLSRLIGYLQLSQTVAASTLCVGLIVVDRTWTPIGTTSITPDLDKRWLWWRQVTLGVNETINSLSYLTAAGPTISNAMYQDKDPTFFDISPKVKIEDGKHLALVIYGTGATASTCNLLQLRMLVTRTGRR